ncbi:beta-1,4-galactosyltransferase 6-like [Anneissia japonica]|uniref:beta-1,4-galactosyltransferase 6-like n=1 Tax=Anneissia japonica TaxID=1529436 RepID=UPI0014259604|nr:beta-1,4-galactosyltransferase 6-like [Anneissia japonica]
MINMEKINKRNFLTDLKLNYVLRTLWILVLLGVMTTVMLWKEVTLKSELVYRSRRGIAAPPPSRHESIFKKVKSWLHKPSSVYSNNGNLSSNLNDTITIEQSEKVIFKEHTAEVRGAAHDQNMKLNVNLINRAHHRQSTQTIEECVSSVTLLFNDFVYIPGGHWKPADCLPRWKVALIIPFRDRYTHLPIFLRYIIPMLQRQKLEFGIFVIEQDNTQLFNRAMLLNVGFLEALNFTKWDCFIYHDVDHVPYNDGNYYGCIGMPRHFVSGVDKWGYKLSYSFFFGAVTGMTRGQMYEINGFPNVYWGWGGEDDDIWQRVKRMGYYRTRPRSYRGWYNVIKKDHKSAPKSKERVSYLNHWKKRQFIDGLNNLKYDEPIINLYPLYTNIAVNIQKIILDIDYDDS